MHDDADPTSDQTSTTPTGASEPVPGWTPPNAAPPPPPMGQELARKFCFACGDSIDARAEICPKCGVRQPWQAGMPSTGGVSGDATTRTGKTKIAASLLAIFLGSFGIHKFYLGQTGKGVLYLIFFWTAIPGIVGFIEGIIWLTQSNEKWLSEFGDR